MFSFWSSSWAHCSRFGALGVFFKCHQQLKWIMSVGFKVSLFLSCLRFPRRSSQRRGSSALPGLQLCCHSNARGGGQRGALSTPSTPCGTGKLTLCISLWWLIERSAFRCWMTMVKGSRLGFTSLSNSCCQLPQKIIKKCCANKYCNFYVMLIKKTEKRCDIIFKECLHPVSYD